MSNKLTNSMKATYNIEAVELPSQLFIKLDGKMVALTTFVKENGKLVPVNLQWK